MCKLFRALFLCFLCLSGILQGKEKGFVSGNLMGQLGNQMFIIAATVSLALDNNATPVFPDLVKKKNDNIPLNYNKVFYHLNARIPRGSKGKQSISKYYQEPNFYYEPIHFKRNMCLVGYFQSEKYFLPHKKEVLDLLGPRPEILEYLQGKYSALLSHPNTVAVHMRNYLKEDPQGETFLTYGREYIENAMSLFPEGTQFVIFSNNMAWCKAEIQDLPYNLYFVEGEAHYDDLYLMSLCRHNIVSNSSFSWWGAYLNLNPDKIVIAPPIWFAEGSGIDCRDVVPKEWIVLKY